MPAAGIHDPLTRPQFQRNIQRGELQIRKPALFPEKAVPSSRIRFLALFLLFLPMLSEAQTKAVVNFGRLKNLEFIDQFYDGGMGSLGTGPGPSYGLQFTA